MIAGRWIELEGAANVRDLGGLPAAGGRRVRERRVVRADSLHRLTFNDRLTLAKLRLRTVIDLRSESEVARFPTMGLPEGVEVVTVPWRPPAAVPDILGGLTEMSFVPLAELYEQFVDANVDRIGQVFSVLAAPAGLPALFHCYAGKDRTGITAALLLDLLGVADADIVADYAASDERQERFRALVRPEAEALGFTEADRGRINPDLVRAPAGQMVEFLRTFRQRWGSAAALLQRAGLVSGQLAGLREALLEPAGAGEEGAAGPRG